MTFLHRRQFLHFAAGAVAMPALPRIARAQAYPARPVRIVVGFAAGGSTDILARLMAQRLSERFGQQFFVENRPGAGGNIATEIVVRAPADGHTLLVVSAGNAVNTTLYNKLSFVFLRDIAPIANMFRQPQVILAHPSVPAKTLPDLIAYAKANPGKITMASAGMGSTSHLAGELFKMMAEVDFVHVPYRGAAPAFADLLGGQVLIAFAGIAASIDYVKAAQLRALAVTSTTRSEVLADIPTAAEYVAGYEASGWYGIGAPAGTPAHIIDKLNAEANAALSDAKFQARLLDLGGSPVPGSPADFRQLIADETEKWGKVIRAANIKLS
jgi:tripartite-type tricarboxylate transporter receptor subunit TctC